jgi:hypothetical protein
MQIFPCGAQFGSINRTWTQPGGCTRQGARDAFPRAGEPAPGSVHIAPFNPLRPISAEPAVDPHRGHQLDVTI